MWVADLGGEELEEAIGGAVARCCDEGGSIRVSNGGELTHCAGLSSAHCSGLPRELLYLVELEQAHRRIDQHGSLLRRIGEPGVEAGARRRIVDDALELGVRPVAAPHQMIHAEAVAQERHRRPGDPLADVPASA